MRGRVYLRDAVRPGAAEAGHVVLLSDRLGLLPWLLHLARHARRIVQQNLAWAFGHNTVALGPGNTCHGRLHWRRRRRRR